MASRILKASIIIGGAVAGSLRSSLQSTKSSLNQVGGAIAEVDRKQRLMAQSIATFARQGRNVDGLRTKYSQLAVEAEKLRRVQARLASIDGAVAANMDKRAQYRGQIMEAVAMVAVAATPIKLAVDFESAMADVRKVVDFTSAAQEQLITDQVRKLATRLPMAAKDIAQIVAAGGQSGLAADELTGFAESAIKRGVAFNMTAEEAGQMMAELRSAFRIGQDEVNALTDKMNLLANTTAASEVKIANVVRRVGPLGEVAGLASGEIAALGATLVSMGVQEEVAATGIQNLMLGLVAGEAATKAQRKAFKQLGLDSGQVAKSMQADAKGTILQVLAQVRKLDAHEQASALQQLFGKESIKAIAPLLNNTDALADNLDKVTDAQRYGGAVDKEYAARAATTANTLQLFKNRLMDLGIGIGNVLLPAVNRVVTGLGPIIERVTGFVSANPGMTKAIIGTATALVGLRLAAIAGGYAFTFIKAPVLSVLGFIQRWRAGNLLASMGRITPVAIRVASAFRTVAAVVAGIGGGPIAIAIAAITVGALVVRKYWEPIKAFFYGLWTGIAEAGSAAWAELSEALAPLRPAWDAVSAALAGAWQWITNMLAPTETAADSLATVGGVGRAVGQLLFVNFRLAIKAIGGVVKAVVWLGGILGTAAGWVVEHLGKVWDKIKDPAGAAIDWIMSKLQPLLDGIMFVRGAAAKGLGWVAGKAADAMGLNAAPMPEAAEAVARDRSPRPSNAAPPVGSRQAVPQPLAAQPSMRPVAQAMPQPALQPRPVAAAAAPPLFAAPRYQVPGAPVVNVNAPTVIAMQPAQAAKLPQIGQAVGKVANLPQPQPRQAQLPEAVQRPAAAAQPRPATIQQTNHFVIQQLPGESSEALARRIAQEQRRQQGVASRGSMADRE